MPIPRKYRDRRIYHFTHIDNLPGLLKRGFLCNNHPDFPGCGCRSVAERGIQERRAKMRVTCGPRGTVHDYVPLYFGSLSPMLLAVVNRKNVDQAEMLYFEFPISLVWRPDVVFTDASANTDDPPNFYSDPADLAKLNWAEIDSLKWKSANETLRHQRMAEVLARGDLRLEDAIEVVVWNEAIKERVQKIAEKSGAHFPEIGFQSWERRHFFTKFFSSREKGASLVAGPKEIARKYAKACSQIAGKTGQKADASFGTPKRLLQALRRNFDCLPQTAELVGLQSENVVHKDTVDVHTIEVVETLRALPEFEALPAQYRDLVELAAYLHDIGKGPKARWEKNGGVQKVDPNHPVGAMPMVVDILTKHVRSVRQEDAEFILKLICYHDLVGDVLGKGRDERQISDVARNKLELDALFALGKADATSLAERWWDEESAGELYERCREALSSQGGA